MLVVYEHAVIQTPSCLGSPVNPRIACIPSRFIAARTFFFPLSAPSRSLPPSSFLPSRQPLSLTSGSSDSRRLAASPRFQREERERDATREKRDSGAQPCKNFGLPSSRRGACPPGSIYLKLTGNKRIGGRLLSRAILIGSESRI